MNTKLTGPQRELLTEMLERPAHVVTFYPPAKKLVEKGFAVWREWRSGTPPVLTITPAGKEAIK